MPVEKQDSNIVGLFKVREADYGITPTNAAWQTRSPTAMDDMGGEFTKTDGRVFSPSRQRRKGSVVDMDANGGFTEFFAFDNLFDEQVEDFFFARVRYAGMNAIMGPHAAPQTFTINPADSIATVTGGHGFEDTQGPFQVTAATTLPTGLTAATDYWVVVLSPTTFQFASSYANAVAGTPVLVTTAGTGALTVTQVDAVVGNVLTVRNSAGAIVGSLLELSGFTNAANNGFKTVTAVAGSKITLAGMVNEAAPPARAAAKTVGQKFAAGDLAMAINTVSGNTQSFTLTATAGSFLPFNLVPGSWVYIGGDAANSFFEDAGERVGGYARIGVNGISATGKVITFDKAAFTPKASAGAGKSVEVYFSDVIKNEADPDDIVRFSSTIERTLGRDDNGIQSEFLTGCVANELAIEGALASEITAGMGYVAQKTGTRTGTEGPLSRRVGNTILPAFTDSAYNTTSNLYRIRLGLIDPENMAPTAMFARLESWSLTINNNVSSAKAQGVLGGFDVNVGNFDVDGELNAYFSTVDAIHAVKCNWDVTLDAILAKNNQGVYYDIPLIGLGGGMLSIEMDQAIMLPLEAAAAESPFGHTALMGRFSYLPDVAMPDQDC